MLNYQKSISYLDYLENGMKIRNAGFVRLEERSGQMRLEVRMKNLPEMFSGQYDLHADCGGVVGKISLNRGNGSCCIVWDRQRLEQEWSTAGGRSAAEERSAVGGRFAAAERSAVGRRMNMAEAGGIYLRLPGRRLVQTVWPSLVRIPVEAEMPEEVERQEAMERPEEVAGQDAVERPEEVERRAAELSGERGSLDTMSPMEIEQPNAVESLESEQQQSPKPQLQQPETLPPLEFSLPSESFPPKQSEQPERSAPDQLSGDKWEQLTRMYPVIHPFNDGRAYLSVAPKDFVVLCRDYQKMVHNSFLLHGFYNYHHLLLGKIREKDEWRYYLGVPGNFYTREKMVAEMFGFEAFEGEKNPASTGDFGYYMKQVDI